tara:strand:+ start:40053 stop:40622 length:570 start_codon:yes stop_codon:yes gene_type:complete
MVLQDICTPALIYLVFSITQIVIDTVQGKYNMAFIKLWVALIFTILLNFLCISGLGIVSWLIVFIPFILMTVIVSLLLLMFGLDPLTGRRPRILKNKHNKHHEHNKHNKHHEHNKHNKHHEHNKHQGGHKGRHRLHYLQSGALDNKKHKKHMHHKFNGEYDEADTSHEQRKVLDDAVRSRTNLLNDPLQ